MNFYVGDNTGTSVLNRLDRYVAVKNARHGREVRFECILPRELGKMNLNPSHSKCTVLFGTADSPLSIFAWPSGFLFRTGVDVLKAISERDTPPFCMN